MITVGPLPWDVLTDPSDVTYGVNSQTPRGVQYLGPMLGPLDTWPNAPVTPQNAPPFDSACWSPQMLVPACCEPFWQVQQWELAISCSFTISGIAQPFEGSGSVLLSPALVTSAPSANPPPFYLGGEIATSVQQLPQCCGFVTDGVSGLTWAANSTTGYPGGTIPVVAGYLQSLLMTPGNMSQSQTCPVVAFETPYVSSGGPQAMAVATGPLNGVLTNSGALQVSVSAPAWSAHNYSVPLSLSDPNGNLYLVESFGVSAVLSPGPYWQY